MAIFKHIEFDFTITICWMVKEYFHLTEAVARAIHISHDRKNLNNRQKQKQNNFVVAKK